MTFKLTTRSVGAFPPSAFGLAGAAAMGLAGSLAGSVTRGVTGAAMTGAAGTIATSVFPIRASSNGRFLQTASGQPFLLVADSPMCLVTNVSTADAESYIDARAAQGFNALQFDIVATSYTGNNNANYGTLSGVTPFTSTKVTTPNSTYFALVDALVNYCATKNILAVLNPYETGGGQIDLRGAGTSACNTYGQFLGNRYKSFPNVMWLLGNDFAINDQTDFDVVNAMAQGILSTDTNHLMTIELNFHESTSFDNTGGFGDYGNTSPKSMTVNGAYTYGPTYGYQMICYNGSGTSFAGTAGTNNASPVPTILLEATYEFENNDPGVTEDGNPLTLRKQSYWTSLAGSSGQLYGNGYVWALLTAGGPNVKGIGSPAGGVGFPTGSYVNNLASPGALQLIIWKNFFTAIPWQSLVPDQTHVVGTSGYGTPANTGLFASNNYVTVAATADGHCAVAYFPLGSSNTVTFDMTKFAGTVTAQWFDPTNAAFTSIGTFANTGTHNFSPTGNNNAGDPDWVLLLTA